MDGYRTSAHARFDLRYHFVWIVKYRRRILTGVVGHRLRELVIQTCKANEIEILQGHVAPEHVHLYVSAPPNISPSKIMQYLKGRSSRKLMMEFRHIDKMFWGRHMWARGYFVATSGNVTDEVVKEYIRLQMEDEPRDGGESFKVEKGD